MIATNYECLFIRNALMVLVKILKGETGIVQ